MKTLDEVVWNLMKKVEWLEKRVSTLEHRPTPKIKMMYCKICGLPLPGRWKGDFDDTLYHAWLYHPEETDYYGWNGIREIIEKTGILQT